MRRKTILEDLLQSIFEDITEDNAHEVVVAYPDDEILEAHKNMMRQKKRLKIKGELIQAEFEARLKLEFEEKMEPLNDEMEKIHKDFWNTVYKRYNLDPTKRYNIDTENKLINQLVELSELGPDDDSIIN